MNGFVWISDVHYSASTIQIAEACVEQALTLARLRGLPLLITGDLNDTKAILRSESIRSILKLCSEYSDVLIYVLIGNHDLESERQLENHSLNFLKACNNVTIIDKPEVNSNWPGWYFIPYQNSAERFVSCIRAARDFGVKRIICHQGFFGAKMGNHAVDQTSISPLEMKDFEVVLTGHYHEHQRAGMGNIIYCGSPYTVSFAEAGQDKFIHVVDPSLAMESIPTNVRKHVSIAYHQKMSPTCVSPVGVRVKPEDLLRVEIYGEKAWINTFTKDKLAELHGTKNISIVPKPEKQGRDRVVSENVFQVAEVVKSYLTSANTELPKDELLSFFSKELA